MISPLPVVVFTHGSMMFGLEAHRVAGRGLVDEQHASVVSFSALYAMDNACEPADDDTITQWLRLRGRTADWLLGLTDNVDLIELEPRQIYPLPEHMAQRSTFAPLQALGFHQQHLVALLDVDLLEQRYRQISRI